jgi:hypothetical protein
MVCHDVMSFDCLLPVNLLLLKSVLTVHHLLCDLFKQRQSDSGAEHDAPSSPLLHLNASGLRKHACPKTERATCTGSQCCACVEADDWHTKTAPKDKTGEKVSLLPLAAVSGLTRRLTATLCLRCAALLCCASAALHCIIVRERARAKVRSRFLRR